MTSKPPGRCCFEGVKHEGEAKGEIKNIGNIPTYFTYPSNKNTRTAILILTDARGMHSINIKLIADQFAANGYFTLIPDILNGAAVPLNPPATFDLTAWIQNDMPRSPTVDPIVETTIKHLRGELGVKKLGGVGYCFGGKYVCRWLKAGCLDAGFVAHPSLVERDELEGIKGPLSVAAAETDETFPASKRRETEDILEKMDVPYQMSLFSDVAHGFAVRADLAVRPARFAKEMAFAQAVGWFGEYLK